MRLIRGDMDAGDWRPGSDVEKQGMWRSWVSWRCGVSEVGYFSMNGIWLLDVSVQARECPLQVQSVSCVSCASCVGCAVVSPGDSDAISGEMRVVAEWRRVCPVQEIERREETGNVQAHEGKVWAQVVVSMKTVGVYCADDRAGDASSLCRWGVIGCTDWGG